MTSYPTIQAFQRKSLTDRFLSASTGCCCVLCILIVCLSAEPIYAQEIQFRTQGRTLDILGTAKGDRVQLSYSENRLKFRYRVLDARQNDRLVSFAVSSVGKIRFFGGPGDDFFLHFEGTDPTLHPQMELYGGTGEDELSGGSKPDLVSGGEGNDSRLRGNGGADIVLGGDGSDSLYGGRGDDLLCGGPGGDFMDGESGDDWLFSEGDQAHLVKPGTGSNRLISGGCLLNPRLIMGDWDGNGTEDIGWFSSDRAIFVVPGAPRPFFEFGLPGDTPLVGDWDGDKKDQVGVFRGVLNWFGLFVPDEGLAGYGPDGVFEATGMWFGLATDQPVVGDWDADGRDQIGVFRDGQFFLDNGDGLFSGTAGFPEFPAATFGQPGDIAVAGDWDGNGRDEPGVYRPSTGTWHLDGRALGFLAPYGPFEWPGFSFGTAGDRPIVGDWHGDKITDVGVLRGSTLLLDAGPRGWQGTAPEELPNRLVLE